MADIEAAESTTKENPKQPRMGPVAWGNAVLDATSETIANFMNAYFPYPTDESVAETRRKLEEQRNADTIDPVTGAQYAYYPKNVDGHVMS